MIRVLLFSLVFLLIMSCDKNDHIDTTAIIPDPIIPLTAGNYWIYQSYTEDVDGVFQPKSSLDSMYVEGSWDFNGDEYYSVQGYSICNVFQNLRDSSGYLLNSKGNIDYSPNHDDGVLYVKNYNTFNGDNIYASYEMEAANVIETPVGNFNARSLVGRFDYSESTSNCDEEIRTYFFEGIGEIRSEIFYFTDCRRVYRELIRYNIQ